MGEHFVRRLRNFAAILITLSGIAHIAALWQRELTEIALADALLGSVYLIIGLGLYGQSRFTLFMGIVTPAAAAAWVQSTLADAGPIYSARLAVDAVVVFCCAVVLWRVRNQPSV
jgi:hypothetical protein